MLIGRATFSAAGNFAAEIDNFTRATFVGEPTGGGVDTYGDTNAIILPTSGLNVHIAAEYHSRQRGPKDRRLAVAPDIRVEPSSKDYFARRDPVARPGSPRSLGDRGRPSRRARCAMVVDEVERVPEDQPAHVLRLEEVAREAGLEAAHRAQPLERLLG